MTGVVSAVGCMPLLDSAPAEAVHRSRIYLPPKPSNSRYANLPAIHETNVPESIPTVSINASDKGISRLSMSGFDDVTWHTSGAPFDFSKRSIDCADC